MQWHSQNQSENRETPTLSLDACLYLLPHRPLIVTDRLSERAIYRVADQQSLAWLWQGAGNLWKGQTKQSEPLFKDMLLIAQLFKTFLSKNRVILAYEGYCKDMWDVSQEGVLIPFHSHSGHLSLLPSNQRWRTLTGRRYPPASHA